MKKKGLLQIINFGKFIDIWSNFYYLVGQNFSIYSKFAVIASHDF